MKDFFQSIKRGLVIGVTALIVICGGVYVFIKARSSTNPGTTDDQPNTLYVNNNETLTAAKRNTLADRNRVYDSGRFNVGVTAGYNTTTYDSNRNYYKVTHNLNTDRILVEVWAKSGTIEEMAQPFSYTRHGSAPSYAVGYLVKKIDNNNFQIITRVQSSTSANYSTISRSIGRGTTGQYRVIVRTF